MGRRECGWERVLHEERVWDGEEGVTWKECGMGRECG